MGVAELSDPNEVRRVLDSNPDRALYARADLDPAYAAHARWFPGRGGVSSVALLYRAFGDPVLLTVGSAEDLRETLDSMPEQGVYFGSWEGGELLAVAGTHDLPSRSTASTAKGSRRVCPADRTYPPVEAAPRPATYPLDHAHWKLYPPSLPSTSSTSPQK